MSHFLFSRFPELLASLTYGIRIAPYAAVPDGTGPKGSPFSNVDGTDLRRGCGTISQLQQLCSLTQDVCVFRSLERYPQAHETMRLLNSFAPQLVFLGTDDEAAAHAVEHDIRSIQPSTAILGVSARSRHAEIFETAFGGFSVCPIPCEPEEFRGAVFHALEAGCGKKNASVFAFQPSKAGSGATTTALFVANILSAVAQKKVLLLECDLHAGPISMLYNLRPAYSIMDALEDSHRLTDQAWNEMVMRTGGIDVLSSVSRLGVRKVSPWGYQRLLSFVRNRYDVVIADLPEVVNDATEVVSAPPIRSLSSPHRQLRHFISPAGVAMIWKHVESALRK